ncbi:uncharacterized protein ACLA_001690 [Aspergillus clavatus NRRL 1]|uniref:Uncharacterized protein n=1 Tax=Aspergillus clavatus (strain ATCC 1007 / CBS 513.65 / DSM 816 / NCTC 3887 / NRRL 1 / QM 1276 / 107) TaxID=344612 RepID=A1C4Z0_ASPCL|nr:uncharacterized protein ACLA_001690 [Aspergillus clavatus NRRL 1]EAW14758.1 conserved hypothetical protein [Aspergillus clavatus NRRL 1]
MEKRQLPAFIRLFRPASRFNTCTKRGLSTPPTSVSRNSRFRLRRLRRLNSRLPMILRSYTTPLLGAPGRHITSFLILHELTAIVPLFGLVAAFHYGNWLPDFTSNSAFEEGVQRFGRWLRKKGWINDGDADNAGIVTADRPVAGNIPAAETTVPSRVGSGEKKGVRLVLEFATAYAITKALLPVRIAASVWATPWFARVIISPIAKGAKALLRNK